LRPSVDRIEHLRARMGIPIDERMNAGARSAAQKWYLDFYA
jgi:hypothetical protein